MNQNRRTALKTLAALATIQIVPRHVVAGGGTPPSEEITRAIIGCGGISQSHLTMPGKLLALCDVDANHLAARMQQAGAAENGIKGYHDFREVLERKDIDVIHVATPPHWHAPISIAAARAGKDVWCEKPMSRTIGEGIEMVKAVERHQRIFRLNTWFRFKDTMYDSRMLARDVRKAVMHGLLGDGPLRVTVSGVTGFDWKFGWSGRTDLTPQEVPKHFDYDFWLGASPFKPYHPHRTHGTFRGYWDYDGGGLGDMGQHYLDPVQYILGKDEESPVTIEIDADPQHPDAIGSWRRIEYTYSDGTKIILDGENKDKDAVFIRGSKSWIGKGYQSDIPELRKKLAGLADPPKQDSDFLECVRSRRKFALNEANGFRSCTLVNLGVTAHRLNKSLRFDSKTLRFEEPEANALINQPMRGPWDAYWKTICAGA